VSLEVGRISRAHGLRGEVVVNAITDQAERFVAGATFDSDRGPLTIVACRPFQRGWLATFDGCGTREQAEALRGVVLRADPLDGSDEVFVHQLIGLRVIDQHGIDHGPVVSVEANPAADLLVLEDQALVPMNFVVELDGDRICVDVPPGLLD
jgi:16S rRNA processing protein RimM